MTLFSTAVVSAARSIRKVNQAVHISDGFAKKREKKSNFFKHIKKTIMNTDTTQLKFYYVLIKISSQPFNFIFFF